MAPAADSINNLYVLTGNGGFDANSSAPNNDYGDSLQNDKDFGAGGAALLADLPAGNTVIHALICGGKDHVVHPRHLLQSRVRIPGRHPVGVGIVGQPESCGTARWPVAMRPATR